MRRDTIMPSQQDIDQWSGRGCIFHVSFGLYQEDNPTFFEINFSQICIMCTALLIWMEMKGFLYTLYLKWLFFFGKENEIILELICKLKDLND